MSWSPVRSPPIPGVSRIPASQSAKSRSTCRLARCAPRGVVDDLARPAGNAGGGRHGPAGRGPRGRACHDRPAASRGGLRPVGRRRGVGGRASPDWPAAPCSSMTVMMEERDSLNADSGRQHLGCERHRLPLLTVSAQLDARRAFSRLSAGAVTIRYRSQEHSHCSLRCLPTHRFERAWPVGLATKALVKGATPAGGRAGVAVRPGSGGTERFRNSENPTRSGAKLPVSQGERDWISISPPFDSFAAAARGSITALLTCIKPHYPLERYGIRAVVFCYLSITHSY